MLLNFCQCDDDIVASGSGAIKVLSELEYASEDEEEEFRTPPPDLMTLVIKGCTPWGMFPSTINLMRVADNIVVQGRPNSEGWVEHFSNWKRIAHPLLASSDVVCSCPCGTMRLEDDDGDGLSSEESSSNDSYIEAPLENTQVGGGDLHNLSRRLTIALGHTHTFSEGRSTGSHRGSSEILSQIGRAHV